MLFVVFAGFDSCKTRRMEQKISDIQEKITVGKVESNSLTNQKENAKQEVKNAENNSNQTINNFDNMLLRVQRTIQRHRRGENDSAKNSLKIQAADDICNQRLAKTLDALEAAEIAIKSLQNCN